MKILLLYLQRVYISTSFYRQHSPPSTYDRINGVVEGYNQKLHRDDREHAKSRGLRVNSEVTVTNLSRGDVFKSL